MATNKEAKKEYMRRYYLENKEKCIAKSRTPQRKLTQKAYSLTEKGRSVNKSAVLMYTYGINLEEYESLLELQNNRCAICKFPPKKIRLAVDHIHVSGYKDLSKEEKKKCIRGLLCYNCNKGLLGALEAKGNARQNLLALNEYCNKYLLKGDFEQEEPEIF